MSELPPGWECASLGDLVETRSGNSKLIKGKLHPNPAPGLVPAFSASGQDVWCDNPEWDGDGIVLSAVGARCGKAFLASGRWTAIANTHVLRPRPGVDVRFLWHLVNDEGFWVKGGSAQPFVRVNDSKAQLIRLPPLAEQERIVAAIEEHLSSATALTLSLQELALRIAVFRESSIACAFDESWPRAALEDVLDRFSDCPHRTPKYAEDGIYPALRPRDVVNGVLNLEGAARVDTKEYKLQTARDVPCEGDVVYSRELSYGWASVVPPGARVCLSQGMVLMKPADLRGEYLAAFLNSAEGRRHAHRAATGSAHPHLNLRDIRQYPIPVVPDDLQARVLDQIGAANDASNRLSSAVERALTRLAALRRSILGAAFSGQLVPQDPDDEPASVLLERIRAERAAATPNKRTRKAKAS